MPKHGVNSTRSLLKQWAYRGLVFMLCLILGILFVVNVESSHTELTSSDTVGLLRERTSRVDYLQQKITDLSKQIDTISKTLAPNVVSHNSNNANPEGTILPALSGEGVTVTLSDSPLWSTLVNQQKTSVGNNDLDVNDYVVHQQDLEAVINALWAGGAEAMTIQGQRVLPNTAVRCVGNVLLLHGKQYAPPYRIAAIGPSSTMQEALDKSPQITIYKEYVDSIGLGWKVEESKNLHFAKTSSTTQILEYAHPIGQ